MQLKPSIREKALAAMFERLKGMDGFRFAKRDWPGDVDGYRHTPAIIMFSPGEEPEDERSCNYQITMRVGLSLTTRANEHDDNGAELSMRLAQVKMAVLADPTLGGNAISVEYAGADEPLPDFEGESKVMITGIGFDVQIEHSFTDPTLKV